MPDWLRVSTATGDKLPGLVLMLIGAHHPTMMKQQLQALLLLAVLSTTCVSATWSSPCQNVCGALPVMYPFGTAKGCGSPAFENYINCTKGTFLLYTPTGQYPIQSIDYTSNILIIQDPHMSTCSSMQRSMSFGLPVAAPLTLVSDTIVLLGCASTSAVYNSLSSLCNPAGTPICQRLYACPSITNLGLSLNGPTSSCCVYSQDKLTPPYEINLDLLQCSSYTSVYNFGGASSSGTYQDASHWAFGIALQFHYDETTYSTNCRACEQSNGICAFNVYGFVCVCSAGVNTTTWCFGDSDLGTGRLHLLHQSTWKRGLMGLLGFQLAGLI